MTKISCMKILLISIFMVNGLSASAFSFPWSKAKDISLSLPLKCTMGKDCFVLYYPDRIVENGFRDYKCGKLSFENNQSVVFDAIKPNDDGLEVLAAAPGVVSKVVLAKPNKGIQSLIETGVPYIVISHPGGYKTKYSFLNQNRIMVKKGQRVQEKEAIAYTGKKNEGLDEVYFTLSRSSKAIDPFLGPNASYGCDTVGKSLWKERIPYAPITVVEYAFLSKDNYVKNLSFNIRTWGLSSGDVETIKLYDSDSFLVADTVNRIDDDGMFYESSTIYNENDEAKLEEGLWTAIYEVTRNGKQIFKTEESFVLNSDKKAFWKKI